MKNSLAKIRKFSLPSIKKAGYSLLPQTPGVYIFFQRGKPIYIGKAINLKRRVRSYFDLDLEPKTRKMVMSAEDLSFIKVTSELESLLLEAKLIRLYMPQYNIAAKDDKHPLYIRITKEIYPRIITARKISETEPNLAFYGPFPSSLSVRQVLRMLRRIFPYSDHKIAKTPCLYSHIGLCNPCPSLMAQTKDPGAQQALKKAYIKNIRNIKRILDGNIEKVKKSLIKEMAEYSGRLAYEEAARVREQIKRLEYIIAPQMPIESFMQNPNLYVDLREKELKDLKRILNANGLNIKSLKRIECFDIAHLAGVNPTASMVTFRGAEADKDYYRHFRIRQRKGNSDTDSMKEVIKRRKNHFQDWGTPDLIIVDGGKPQVSVFIRELGIDGIPIVGLAKRFETLVLPRFEGQTLTFKEVRLVKGAALNLVQRIRDEAHRFARKYHHKLLSNSILNEKPA